MVRSFGTSGTQTTRIRSITRGNSATRIRGVRAARMHHIPPVRILATGRDGVVVPRDVPSTQLAVTTVLRDDGTILLQAAAGEPPGQRVRPHDGDDRQRDKDYCEGQSLVGI